MSNCTFIFRNRPEILSASSAVGTKEGQGPMKEWFDSISEDDTFGQKTWEKAESYMLKMAVEDAITKAGKTRDEVDVMLSGDLLNQIMSSSFMARDMQIPFIGLYGACSTMTESLMLAGVLTDGGYCCTAVGCASSHFCTAERQFRLPLEHAHQKPPSAQSTVTGAGAMVVSKADIDKKCAKPDVYRVKHCRGNRVVITAATVGRVFDPGIRDSNEMGAAMAPAAVDLILRHLNGTGRSFDDYDLIITGDLGVTGKAVAADILKQAGVTQEQIDGKLEDCGTLIYDESSGCKSGGSGCGCSASIFSGYIYKQMKRGVFRRVLIISTGAMLSTISPFQGESIPGIAHGVELESEGAL